MASDLLRVRIDELSHRVELGRSDSLLVVGAGASWFRAPGAERIAVDRDAPRRILQALVSCRCEGGAGLTTGELAAAGWPGEQFVADAGVNRAYVALSSLRKLGLRDLLLRQDGRVRLDPKIPIVVAADDD